MSDSSPTHKSSEQSNQQDALAKLQEEKVQRRNAQIVQALLEHLPLAVWTTDLDLRITSSKRPDPIPIEGEPNYKTGLTLMEYFGTEDPQFVPLANSYRALEGESTHYKITWEGIPYDVNIKPLTDTEENIVGTIGIALDVTQLHNTMLNLRESEEIFHVLGKNIPGVVYLCANDERYRMEYLNDAIVDLVGIPAEDFLDDRISIVDLFHPEDAPAIAPAVDAALKKHSQYHITYRLRHADQRWIWVEEYGQGVFDREGTLRYLEGSIFDITSEKEAVEALQKARDELELRVQERTADLVASNEELHEERRRLQQMLDLHERERKLVAYDIHDGMVQDMTASLLFLEAANAAQPNLTKKAKEHCDRAIASVRKALEEARRMINGLQPPVLEQEGLLAAIEGLIAHLPADPPIQIQFENTLPSQRLAPALETTIYRIVQEGLNNISKHSGAEHGKVILRQVAGGIDIFIIDSGKGFVPDQVKSENLGIRGIRERARLLGGSLYVETKTGEGTCLHVFLPLYEKALEEDITSTE